MDFTEFIMTNLILLCLDWKIATNHRQKTFSISIKIILCQEFLRKLMINDLPENFKFQFLAQINTKKTKLLMP